MSINKRILSNTDIREINLEIPKGHQHLRTTIKLRSGEELIFQEAAIANLVRAYISIKTHPKIESCRLIGQSLDGDTKQGYASWQLLECD